LALPDDLGDVNKVRASRAHLLNTTGAISASSCETSVSESWRDVAPRRPEAATALATDNVDQLTQRSVAIIVDDYDVA
jgi:hypothetical protein